MGRCPICKAEDVMLQRIIIKNRERFVCGTCYEKIEKERIEKEKAASQT